MDHFQFKVFVLFCFCKIQESIALSLPGFCWSSTILRRLRRERLSPADLWDASFNPHSSAILCKTEEAKGSGRSCRDQQLKALILPKKESYDLWHPAKVPKQLLINVRQERSRNQSFHLISSITTEWDTMRLHSHTRFSHFAAPMQFC